MNEHTSVGIDLAKNVFAVHAVAMDGRVVLRCTVRRGKLMETIARLPPSLIGLEACTGAHEWARRFQSLGHRVRLMAPAFVSPYRKSGKNDGNDAEAICEAVMRPNMRFVPVKTIDQQALLTLHRVRQGFVSERTAVVNRLRGLLAEFGVVLPQRIESIRRGLHECTQALPGLAARALRDLQAHLQVLDDRIGDYDRELKHLATEDEQAYKFTGVRVGDRNVYEIVCKACPWEGLSTGSEFSHISRWLTIHPNAVVIPISQVTVTLKSNRVEWVYVWIEDGDQSVNVSLVRDGIVPKSAMIEYHAATPTTSLAIRRLISDARYDERVRMLSVAEAAAKHQKLGVWSDDMAAEREIEALNGGQLQ